MYGVAKIFYIAPTNWWHTLNQERDIVIKKVFLFHTYLGHENADCILQFFTKTKKKKQMYFIYYSQI